MSYKVFDQKKTRARSPAATINPAGRIYFNQEAASWLAYHRVKRVLLLWMDEANMVGIKAGRSGDPRAYSLAFSNRGGGASITAKAFLRWIGFQEDQPSVTVDVQLNDEKTLMEFEIPAGCLEED